MPVIRIYAWFSVWKRTGSKFADINWFQSQTGNFIPIQFSFIYAFPISPLKDSKAILNSQCLSGQSQRYGWTRVSWLLSKVNVRNLLVKIPITIKYPVKFVCLSILSLGWKNYNFLVCYLWYKSDFFWSNFPINFLV